MHTIAFTRCAVLAALVLGATTASAPSVAPINDPYAIFANARAHWEQQHYPRMLDYTVAVTVTEGGVQKVEHYASSYDAVNDVVTTDCVSDYERAHPPSGKGIMVGIGLPFGILKIGHTGNPPIDYLGVPKLAPNYSFGIAPFVPARSLTPLELVTKIRAQFHDPAPTPASTAGPSGLQQIAVVTARDRHYRIELVGVEPLEGAPAYHLMLQPVSQPKRYRLRDLWIDTQTYATRQLVTDGNFTSGPWPGALWTVQFAQIDGATYIAEETAVQTFAYRDLIYPGGARVDIQDVRNVDAPVWSLCQPRAADVLSEPRAT